MLDGPRLRWSVVARREQTLNPEPRGTSNTNDLGEHRYSISCHDSKNLFSSNIFIISASALFSVSVLMTAIVST